MIRLRSFFTALNFLTRISLFQTNNWKEDDFSKSVKLFPLVGAVLGFLYATFAYLCLFNGFFTVPSHIFSALLIFLTFYLSGGLFFDGFMDTMDGVFSGREREKILEIMKDSRVGANAVMAFGVYIILLYSSFLDMDKNIIIYSLFSAPIISHFTVVISIIFFPYARKEGVGKMFEVSDKKLTFCVAALITVLFICLCGILSVIALFISLIFMFLFNKRLIKLLGGLTGDTYGAVAVVSLLLTQISFIFFFKIL